MLAGPSAPDSFSAGLGEELATASHTAMEARSGSAFDVDQAMRESRALIGLPANEDASSNSATATEGRGRRRTFDMAATMREARQLVGAC